MTSVRIDASDVMLLTDAANEIERLRKDAARMKKGLEAVEELINQSSGVAGLHLNGDLALWDELRTSNSYEK